MKTNSNLLSAEELSAVLRISEYTIKMLCRTRQIPCVYIKRRPLFDLKVLSEHFSKLEGGAA